MGSTETDLIFAASDDVANVVDTLLGVLERSTLERLSSFDAERMLNAGGKGRAWGSRSRLGFVRFLQHFFRRSRALAR